MKTKLLFLACTLTALLSMGSVSLAAPIGSWGDEIDVVGYDLLNTLALGARDGATYGGQTNFPDTGIFSYTGSGGSLNNDTIEGVSKGQTLFQDNIDGTAIVLHLPDLFLYNVTAILIYGGNPINGIFPDTYTGALGAARIGVVEGEGSPVVRGTVQNTVADPDSAWVNAQAEPVDDYLLLSEDLSQVATNEIILDLFDSNTDNYFAFSEIKVFGVMVEPDNPDPSAVPEPSTMLLLGAGLVSVALFSRRRRMNIS